MDQIKVFGGARLNGEVLVSGSKNASLPILIASLLTSDRCRFSRVPSLMDVRTALKLLEYLGVEVQTDSEARSVELKAESLNGNEAPYDQVRKMRASVLVLGPLLARLGKARVSLPGGCAIGARPIHIHLRGLEKLGAKVELDQGYIVAETKGLKGARFALEFPSVGATEILMMAACLAKGETVLENCAREPEISDLANCLRSMGAQIEGDGTENIHIQGRASLKGCDHRVIGDRIEAGTYLLAGFATKGKVRVKGVSPDSLETVLGICEEAGARVSRFEDAIELDGSSGARAIDVTTLPFPGFPTDMQAQFMALMATAKGTSQITETIFEGRFMHVPELCRLGARIKIKGKTATVEGVERLKGAPLMATDLRASASLVMGGLCAEGETVINRVYHLDRGYEKMEEKLKLLGARIERVKN